MTPYKMQNLVYEWVDFSKFGQIWVKIGSNLRKFLKKLVILCKIWPKIGPIGIWMGYFFLKNWYLYGSTFKFRGGTSLPKPNLSTPRDLYFVIINWNVENKPILLISSNLCQKRLLESLNTPSFEIIHLLLNLVYFCALQSCTLR